MAGTKEGGRKAADKNLAKDPDFYKKIGMKGGSNGHTGGFAANPDLARIAGAKGGRISRRPSKTTTSLGEIRPLASTPYIQHVRKDAQKVANYLQVPHNNLSGDKEHGNIVSTASQPTTKRSSVWHRVFRGAGSTNR